LEAECERINRFWQTFENEDAVYFSSFFRPPFSAFKPGMCGELRERWIELPQAHLSLGMRSLPLWEVGTSCDFRVVDPVPGR
jgi:hypothetical protein